MADAKVDIKIITDATKAIDDMRKMEAELLRVKGQLKASKDEGRQFNRTLGTVQKTALGIASALGIGGGMAAGVALIKREFEAMERHMRSISRESREAASSLVAFAQMQEKGTLGTRARQAVQMGAQYGVAPGAAWSTIQALQAKTGTFQQGMAAAEASFRLSHFGGVPAEGARTAVSVGMGLGLSPDQAARAAYAAGKASELTPAQLAEMSGKGLPAYAGVGGGPVTGYGVAAALSGLISDPGELGTYTRQVGMLLQQRTGKVGKTWARLGFKQPGQQPMEQMQALADAGITTMGDLQQAGFAKKESMGLGILLGNLPAAKRTMEEVQRIYGQPGVIAAERTRMEAEAPMIARERRLREQEARYAGLRTTGAIAGRAMAREEWERGLGIKTAQAGYYWEPEEGGRLGAAGRFKGRVRGTLAAGEMVPTGGALPTDYIVAGAAEATRAGIGGVQAGTVSPFTMPARLIGILVDALKNNTRALEAQPGNTLSAAE